MLDNVFARDEGLGILPTANKYSQSLTMPFAHMFRSLSNALLQLKQLCAHLKAAYQKLLKQPLYEGYLYPVSEFSTAKLEDELKKLPKDQKGQSHQIPPDTVDAVRPQFESMRTALVNVRAEAMTVGALREVTADSPLPFDCRTLLADEFFLSATSRFRARAKIGDYLATCTSESTGNLQTSAGPSLPRLHSVT